MEEHLKCSKNVQSSTIIFKVLMSHRTVRLQKKNSIEKKHKSNFANKNISSSAIRTSYSKNSKIRSNSEFRSNQSFTLFTYIS